MCPPLTLCFASLLAASSCSVLFGSNDQKIDAGTTIPLDAAPIACNEGCPSELPICSENDICVRCDRVGASQAESDSACLELNTDSPICESYQCVQCRTHADCESDACDIRNGECLDEDKVLYVDPIANNPDIVCSKATPCQSLTEARDRAKLATAPRIIVIKPGSTLRERVAFLEGEVGTDPIRIIGYQATLSGTPVGDFDNAIDIVGANVSVDGLNIEVEGDPRVSSGIRCFSSGAMAPGQAAAFDVRISGFATQPAINIQKCSLILERSMVSGNGGGILIRNGSFRIQHSIIVGNDETSVLVSGIEIDNDVDDNHDQILEFSTIADNAAGSRPDGLSCIGDAPLVAKGLIIRGAGANPGSLINGGGTGTCSVTYSNTFGGTSLILTGDGNLSADPLFESTLTYELSSASPGRDVFGLGGSFPIFTLDAFGSLRSKTGPDMGAVEQ